MADAEDIQPLVCDNGTGMVKVCQLFLFISMSSYVCVCTCLDKGL